MKQNLQNTRLYDRALGCILGGVIGDAMGAPAEGKDYRTVEERYGWINDFEGTGTDDTIMKNLLAEALIATGGHGGRDAWAAQWLAGWKAIFGDKVGKFFISVLHTARKLRRDPVPRMAALGNMPSSSSAMAISPVGIVNACHPREAARQAYDAAGLIHIHDVGFCQDAAAAMAAAVAEAFKPGASVPSMIDAAMSGIDPLSGKMMRELIETVQDLAVQRGDFKSFRAAVYERKEELFHHVPCDSRETAPFTLAILRLSGGDFEKAVAYGANFGRDADTISSMVGAMAGALVGAGGIKAPWVEKIRSFGGGEWRLAEALARTAISKDEAHREEQKLFQELL